MKKRPNFVGIVSLGFIFLILAWTTRAYIAKRDAGYDPDACVYVSDRPDLSDACAFQNSWPKYYADNVHQYFGESEVPTKSVSDLRIATIIATRANPILFRCKLDKAELTKLVLKKVRLAVPAGKPLQPILAEPIYGQCLASAPYNSVTWWPPPAACLNHIETYRGKMRHGVDDVDPGTAYYILVDRQNNLVYGIVW